MRYLFLLIASLAIGVTGCGQDAHHLASIASKLGRQVAAGSERVRETALGRLFQNRSVLDQVPLTDRARIRLRLDRSLQGLDISVRQVETGCLELTGEVPDEAARQAAVQSIQQVPGVEKVADALKIAGAIPPAPEEKKEEVIPPSPGNNAVPAPMPGGGNLANPSAAANPASSSSPNPVPANPMGSGTAIPAGPMNGGVNKQPASGPPPLPVPGTIPPPPGGSPGASPVTIPPPPPTRPG